MAGVSRYDSNNKMYPVGYGYIVIPDTEDREQYIETCFRKERVSIQLDGGGGVIKNCFISKNILQQLIFPIDNKLGSAVAFIVPKFHNIPIIVGVVSRPDETQLLEENSFKKIVKSDSSLVSIEGKGKSGELFINVESEYENEGNLYITLKGKNNTANFNVECFGNININSTGKVSVKSSNDVSISSIELDDNGEEAIRAKFSLEGDYFRIEDKGGNIIESKENGIISIFPYEKCKLFNGAEPLVKGEELKTQLNVMKDRIDKIIKALNAGFEASSSSTSYATAVSAGLLAINDTENFDNINSKKSFTD